MEKKFLISETSEAKVLITYVNEDECSVTNIKEVILTDSVLMLLRDYMGRKRTFVFPLSNIQCFEF